MEFGFVQWVDGFIGFDGSYLPWKVLRGEYFLANQLRLALHGRGAIDGDDRRDEIATGGG